LVPPLEVQNEIVATMGAIDDKILLLQETNKSLEAIAQELFKSWFVDFDPVHAKAEGRDCEGVLHENSDLFPSEFEESELGAIPKGWRVASLDSIAEFLNGLAMQKFPVESDTEWLPVIKIAQLRKGDTAGADRASLSVPSEYVVQDDDVLFSWSGSLEVEIWCGGEGALNQHLFKVTSKQFPKWFYYLWTKYHLPSFRETAAHKATTMGHIQRGHLSEAKVIIPPDALLKSLAESISPLIQKASACKLEAKTLGKMRDVLLPRLISGKLRIDETKTEAQ
jgi:type I restriction enzyme S subunit